MYNREQLIENAVVRLKQSSHEICNAAGFKIDIDTLTARKAAVSEQKFYTVKPSDFMPVELGQAPWFSDRLTYKSFSISDDFEKGIIETGSNSGRLSRVDTRIEGIRVPRKVWGSTINYNLAELNEASISGNWSLVDAKEEARVSSWQLGIQKIAFLGGDSNAGIKGLLTQDNVTINTSVITKSITSMNATEFQTFLGSIVGAYWNNANSTVLPDTFVIPSDDFFGLPTAVDEGFGLVSRLSRLEETFKKVTGNLNFKILHLAYSQSSRNDIGQNRYALYRQDAKSLTMEIPVDYTTTIQDTINGWNYESVGYGQFSGVEAFRPEEMLYFDYA